MLTNFGLMLALAACSAIIGTRDLTLETGDGGGPPQGSDSAQPGGDAGSEGCPALSTTCPNPATTWAEVEPVIIKYCFQCHGEGGIEESMFDYTTYAGEYKNRS